MNVNETSTDGRNVIKLQDGIMIRSKCVRGSSGLFALGGRLLLDLLLDDLHGGLGKLLQGDLAGAVLVHSLDELVHLLGGDLLAIGLTHVLDVVGRDVARAVHVQLHEGLAQLKGTGGERSELLRIDYIII